MNNPNPFLPQGSVLEQNKRRSRMKLAVFCVLAFSVCGLTAMLIQGCKNEKNETPPQPVVDTNNYATDTNLSPTMVTTSAPPATYVSTSAPPAAYVPPVVPEPAGSEYVIVKGDTLAKIAKNNHVSLKALEAANPNVQPTKLKPGQKLTLPAGGAAAPATTGGAAGFDTTGVSSAGDTAYVVKSGDTLTKIAKAHGTTVKLIESENNLSTTKIKVGQKLKIPTKAGASTIPVTPLPPIASAPVPAAAPVAPAPAATPNGQ
jgi:LysM repeat protein